MQPRSNQDLGGGEPLHGLKTQELCSGEDCGVCDHRKLPSNKVCAPFDNSTLISLNLSLLICKMNPMITLCSEGTRISSRNSHVSGRECGKGSVGGARDNLSRSSHSARWAETKQQATFSLQDFSSTLCNALLCLCVCD